MKVEIKDEANGIGFIGLLQLIFITLKLLDKIKWSWFWVLSPIWISIGVFLILLIITLIVWIMVK